MKARFYFSNLICSLWKSQFQSLQGVGKQDNWKRPIWCHFNSKAFFISVSGRHWFSHNHPGTLLRCPKTSWIHRSTVVQENDSGMCYSSFLLLVRVDAVKPKHLSPCWCLLRSSAVLTLIVHSTFFSKQLPLGRLWHNPHSLTSCQSQHLISGYQRWHPRLMLGSAL